MNLVLVMAGLGILLLAGDSLVRGAVALALRLGIPALIVSLTIVAFGTSAPELLVSVQSTLEGVPGLAVGNVVGSNIANVLLVLGVPALISAIDTKGCESARSYIQMLGATVIFIILCFLGPLHIWHGVVLFGLFLAMLYSGFAEAKKHRDSACAPADAELAELEEGATGLSGFRIAVYIILGLVGLPLGAQLLIDGAIGIAVKYGVSDAVIGLTLVAFGTSLPELATTVMAAIRKQADVVMGNVIGSNMFNLLGILGITAFFGPLPVEGSFLTLDLWVMLGASLLLIPFVFLGWRINRLWGLAFCAAYGLYVARLLQVAG
ncbi:calcium/sodium antiporter [Oceanomicrobium pacificus]|uniref:Calcium/sodium antiporter n=1 Tax=Oceanomicrobium pacificus TaxID=2692916 RepID=A0A6B0U7D4_9RHOB|nr:calcium/sodium antiporter [Oceanomicrobium pacificus]MXU66781.1 calcium/sodium antiporter [Oceanomicrobium pacificus]